jgi:hypothetical protein
MGWEIVFVVVELAVIPAALAAIWIGLSRGRWWVRVALIAGGAATLWFVPDYDFLILFTEPF